MTQDQFDLIIAKLNAIAKAVAPQMIDNPLVGSGEVKPSAPTREQVAANPAAYENTQYDPVTPTHRISSSLVIARFESMHKAGEFPGGTLFEWAKIDPAAVQKYVSAQYPGINFGRMSASQRALIGL